MKYGQRSDAELMAEVAALDKAYADAALDEARDDDDEYAEHQRLRRAALDHMGRP